MNSRGKEPIGFRVGRGASGVSVAARGFGRSGGNGGRDVARGRGCGRGGHLLRAGAERPESSAVMSQEDSGSDDDEKGVMQGENVHLATGKCSTALHKQRHVKTMLTEEGTELPKKLNNKVFIDGLPYEHKATPGSSTLEEELMQFVAAWKVGKPVRLIKREGQGFGFLVFHSPHSVDVAVRVLNGRKFLGRKLRVEVPKPKDMTTNDVDISLDAGKSSFARQVLLSDLAKITQPEIVREILRDVAPQLEKRLESIKMTSRNRKAFLTFLSADDVEPAVRFLDGFSMLGRRITAARAAAPGSLPYTKSPGHVLSHKRSGASADEESRGEAMHAGILHGDADEEECGQPVLPLGVVNPPAAQQEARRAGRNVAKELKPSNITGVTEKYNLLEEGPAEVFVGNLGEEITEEQLRCHFSVCGRILSCDLIVNKSTSLPTGIARILFSLPAYASYAQKHLHGSCLHGHVIRVDRGEEPSAPLASDLAPHDGEDVVDEDGYMAHYGVKDKAAYFKGTSLEERCDGRNKSKRARETAVDTKKKRRKTKDEAFKSSGFISAGGSDDDDEEEEERFHDVDKVIVPVTASSGQREPKKRLIAVKRRAKRVKKAFE
ncbi:nuclear cap binding protein, putative [Trypanosoma cruzi]|nr:nuclear cap binding protein, putative [Trypanosoma cruzi]